MGRSTAYVGKPETSLENGSLVTWSKVSSNRLRTRKPFTLQYEDFHVLGLDVAG